MKRPETIWRISVHSQTGCVTGCVAFYFNAGHMTGCLVSLVVRLVMYKCGHVLVV